MTLNSYRRFGGVDVLVNNAGMSPLNLASPASSYTTSSFIRVDGGLY